ncbi:MAG: NAD(P)-dependent oxidoreductase [Candidatus Acidiferrum sp.]
MTKPSVAILGLGIMGTEMAGRLLDAKFPLTVYNRNREKAERFAERGAFVAATPKEAASRADVVICIVADDAASRTVWLGETGVLAGARTGAILIESSTLTVEWIKELAAAVAKKGNEFLDAPVTGSRPQAVAGELNFLVGGSPDALAKARPVLEVLGRQLVHLGPTGSGALLKLINNFMSGVQAASLAEAAAMVSKGGLNRDAAMTILTNGAPASPLVKTLYGRVAANDPTVNFVLRLMAKDMSYAHGEAGRLGLSLRMAPAALEIFKQAIAQGYGEKDFSAVIVSLQN